MEQSQLNKLKNKKIIAAVAVFLILAVLGGVLFLSRRETAAPNDDFSIDSDLPTLRPEDIGMEVTVRNDKKAIMFELTKADDIKHVEYVIEYEAKTDEGIANQGVLGEMNIGEDGITKTEFREFGTCSAGRCRYDDVVSDITINLKVTKNDGKVYQVKKVVEL